MSKSGSHQKILVITQHFWPEAFRINDLCDFLIDKDCEIDVLCGIPNYPKGKFYQNYSYFQNRRQQHHNVNIRRAFEIPRGNNSDFRIFVNYISFPIASLFHLPRLLTKRYDKIFIFQTSPVMMGIVGIFLRKIKKIETTMYVLDLWPENLFSVLDIKNTLTRKIATKVSRWHYRNVDKLIALSEKMQECLLSFTDLPEDKIIVLPQVCEKIYENDIQDNGLVTRFKNGFNVLFTGNISPAQSFETILKAAEYLDKQGVHDINWIVVGDGMSKPWLEKEVSILGLSKNFYFEGFKPITDIPKYTPLADVLIACLKKSELLEATIPAKVMSYIAAGRPIILAMDGEVQDLINHKIKCGYASPTGDWKTLANNINRLHNLTSNQRNQMGKRARDYHFKHFERNMIYQQLYNFIFN